MKILSLFAVSKEEKEVKAQGRIGKALKRGQEALIDGLEARLDAAQDTIDKLTEGKLSKINTDTFNEVYHKAKVELKLVKAELEIAKEVNEELYSSDATESK